jgi:hypothetical protein
MTTRFFAFWMLCGLASITLFGCTTYYRVTDPASGKTYYTTKVAEAGKAGAVKIKDAKSGGTVTLQSSEVHEISQREFNAEIAAGRQ